MPTKEPASNFIGKKYNLLTVIEDLGTSKKKRRVSAVCECGKTKQFGLSDIKNGKTPSCGCLKTERISNLKKSHSLHDHPLYSVWQGMKCRCGNANARSFKTYGGRGVVICEQWKDDFHSFYNWCIENGWREGLVLDKDKKSPTHVGKEYSPEFCCFITPKENANYKSSSKVLEYKGVVKSLAQWSEELGFSYQLVKDRINLLKWNVAKAFETPARKIKK